MSDFPRWKYAVVVVVLLFGILYALPNVFRPSPAVQVSANSGHQVDQTLEQKVEAALAKQHLKANKVSIDAKAGTMMARFSDTSTQLEAYDVIKGALGDDYNVALNLASTVPSWLRSIHANAMPLGLDLQGGVHFLMEVDQDAVRQQQEQRYTDDLRSLLHQNKIRYISLGHAKDGVGVEVALHSSADRDKVANLVYQNYPNLQTVDGSDSDGNVTLTAKLKQDEVLKLAQKTIQQNVQTLRNRINQLGVSEPLIQQQGSDRIVVELPGVQDTADAKRILGAIATLEYHKGYAAYPDPRVQAALKGDVPPEARLYKNCPRGPLPGLQKDHRHR